MTNKVFKEDVGHEQGKAERGTRSGEKSSGTTRR